MWRKNLTLKRIFKKIENSFLIKTCGELSQQLYDILKIQTEYHIEKISWNRSWKYEFKLRIPEWLCPHCAVVLHTSFLCFSEKKLFWLTISVIDKTTTYWYVVVLVHSRIAMFTIHTDCTSWPGQNCLIHKLFPWKSWLV